jgi:hypothetical protein
MPAEDYLGTYEHPGLGRITVTAVDDGLEARFNRNGVTLRHVDRDVWLSSHVRRIELDALVFQFLRSGDGKVESVKLSQEGPVDDVVYTRVE